MGDDPEQQSCCYRKAVPDAEYCAWHADGDETVFKTIPELRETHSCGRTGESRTESGTQIELVKEPSKALLDGADLRGIDLGDAISFSSASLRDGTLVEVDLSGADISAADLRGADLTDATLRDTDLKGAILSRADLTEASLSRAELSGAVLYRTDLTGASLLGATLSAVRTLGKTDFVGVNLTDADLSDATLDDVDFTGANLHDADLTDATLRRANFTDVNFSKADLTRADLEQSSLIRVNLFSADLNGCKLHGATLTDAQINDQTNFRTEREQSGGRSGTLLSSADPRCAYDPEVRDTSELGRQERVDLLSKAADTYQKFEQLARQNAQPSVQSSMFVQRQDIQRKRYWLRGDPLQYIFARVSRSVFKHGESLARIFAWALLIIFGYAAVYAQFNLIRDSGGGFVQSPIDAVYFSTLTFTTLGLGDFQPDPTSELARALVTSQAALGAILIAIFVFVLGRRAAR